MKEIVVENGCDLVNRFFFIIILVEAIEQHTLAYIQRISSISTAAACPMTMAVNQGRSLTAHVSDTCIIV